MKKYSIFALALLLTLSLCACRFGGNDETTKNPGSQQTTDNMPDPTIIDPTILDPTIETNIPDPDVDKDHMIDDEGQDQDGTGNGGMEEDATSNDGNDPLSRIRRRMR